MIQKIRIESFGETIAIGDLVAVLTDSGEVPAPDGEHLLSDGKTVVVTEGGKITELKELEVEAMKDEAPEMDAAPAMTEVIVVGNKLKQPLRGLEARARIQPTVTLSGKTGNECRTHDSVVFHSEIDHVARKTVEGLLQTLTQRGVGVNVGDEVVDRGALTRREGKFGQQF